MESLRNKNRAVGRRRHQTVHSFFGFISEYTIKKAHVETILHITYAKKILHVNLTACVGVLCVES